MHIKHQIDAFVENSENDKYFITLYEKNILWISS